VSCTRCSYKSVILVTSTRYWFLKNQNKHWLPLGHIAAFSCIASIPDWDHGFPYDNSMTSYSLCNAVADLSFIVLMVLLVMTDSVYDTMSNIQHRKVVATVDVIIFCKTTSFVFCISRRMYVCHHKSLS